MRFLRGTPSTSSLPNVIIHGPYELLPGPPGVPLVCVHVTPPEEYSRRLIYDGGYNNADNMYLSKTEQAPPGSVAELRQPGSEPALASVSPLGDVARHHRLHQDLA